MVGGLIVHFRNRYATPFFYLMITGFIGCGVPDNQGLPRYSLSGKVTFNNKPVPEGEIHFSPDQSKGNRGPSASARIVKGRYQTYSRKGVVAGAMIVTITGFDGIPVQQSGEIMTSGTPLFEPFQIEVDFSKEDSQRDFVIPVGAASSPAHVE